MVDTTYTQLLSADQMQQVDRTAADQGIDTFELMIEAGRAVADHVQALGKTLSAVLIVAGTGNNGGDGFIAAELLKKTGIKTTVLSVGSGPIKGSDAEKASAFYSGNRIALSNDSAQLSQDIGTELSKCDLIIDALFGAGLQREVTGIVAELINKINQSGLPVISIDLPSGLDGNDNVVQGVAIQATSTVSFFRAKPAHYLYPGRQLCGELVIKQIGLTDSHLPATPHLVHKNDPMLFEPHLPIMKSTSHKYQRGHVLVRSGPIVSTGAARLSASAALTCGAGVVCVASSNQALAINASHLTAVMLAQCDCTNDWINLLIDKKIDVAVIGPGNGLDKQTKDCVLKSTQTPISLILDADALSCWQNSTDSFIDALKNATGEILLTPHSGEFNRLFGQTEIAALPSKLHQAQAAAALTQTVVIYKGADTVIAAPDGRAAINHNGPPWLATAGSGDVLAGAAAALHAQGMPLFESALAAVWLHGQAAFTLGYPLTAEQLSEQMGRELNAIIKLASHKIH